MYPAMPFALLALSGCATVSPEVKSLARAEIVTAAGNPAGQATITTHANMVTLTVQARGLTPGAHGMHLHAQGNCSGSGFTAAGGHLNPAMHQHGSLNPAGAHLGDLPNLMIARDGAGAATVMLPGDWSTIEPALFDADGTAIVIHAGPDDYKTDPSGNSGARVACGAFHK
jgi:Cu-Zn family superoxide dismutase